MLKKYLNAVQVKFYFRYLKKSTYDLKGIPFCVQQQLVVVEMYWQVN